MKKRILFICIHNSARSQMAEELTRLICPDVELVLSAGLEPGQLNPLAVEVLREEGIDITGKKLNDVFDMYRSGTMFSHVITVCDETSAERCPVFPGVVTRLHWSFPDPSRFEGSWEDRLAQTRVVREHIKEKIHEFCEEFCEV